MHERTELLQPSHGCKVQHKQMHTTHACSLVAGFSTAVAYNMCLAPTACWCRCVSAARQYVRELQLTATASYASSPANTAALIKPGHSAAEQMSTARHQQWKPRWHACIAAPLYKTGCTDDVAVAHMTHSLMCLWGLVSSSVCHNC